VAVATQLVDRNGHADVALQRGTLEEALGRDDFFWLDVCGPSEEDVRLLGEVFGLHPLSIEDSLDFGQRAKLDPYSDYVLIVAFGWSPDEDGLVEVHCYYSERFLLTIRRDPAPALDDACQRVALTLAAGSGPVLCLHEVLDALAESFLAPLERLDDRLESIETEIIEHPSPDQVREVLGMRRELATLRKAIGPQRDLFGHITTGVKRLPGMTEDAEPAFRDLYDHLFRLSEMMDAARDVMTGALDVYLSASSNRLGEVNKQLTVIATIFLPLSFLTGFFGQNFGWMVNEVGSASAFVALGIGLEVAMLAAIIVLFKSRGWF
jgi:magnesium transporter